MEKRCETGALWVGEPWTAAIDVIRGIVEYLRERRWLFCGTRFDGSGDMTCMITVHYRSILDENVACACYIRILST